MNHKNLVKSVMYEAVNNFSLTEDDIPSESNIAVQQYESPYVKGADYDSIVHPDQTESLFAFQDLIRELTGLEIGKYMASADGLEELIGEINKYIGSIKSVYTPEGSEVNQYRFKFQNFNKQKDGDRATLNRIIADKTLEAIRQSSKRTEYPMKLAALEMIRSLIRDYLKYNIGHQTTSTQKISQETELKTFKDLYDKFREKFDVVQSYFPPKESFNFKDVENTEHNVKLCQGKLSSILKAIGVIKQKNSDKYKIQFAFDTFLEDYKFNKPVFEGTGTLSLSKSGEEKALKRLEADNERDKIRKLFSDYLDQKTFYTPDLDTCVEYYSLKYILKALEKFFPEKSTELLEEIKHFDEKTDPEQGEILDKIKEFVEDSRVKLDREFRLLSDFSREIYSGKANKAW